MDKLLITLLMSLLNCHSGNKTKESVSSDDVRIHAVAEGNLEDNNQVRYFPNALIYAYELNGEKGEVWLYVNEATKEILYVPENDMIHGVISYPDGRYKIFGEDESGKRILMTQIVNAVTGEEIPDEALIPLNRYKTISQKNIQQKDIMSRGFEMKYIKMEGGEVLFATTQIPVNSFQIYGFCRLVGDAKLAVDVDYLNFFNKSQVITHIERNHFRLSLLNYGPNPYEINTAGYAVE